MIRYGKPSGALLAQKTHFFEENQPLVEEGERIGRIYRRQPRRTACKCCDARLSGRTFEKSAIEYILCRRCGHLNGAFEDTAQFCAGVYTEAGGQTYARTYSSADKKAYQARVEGIYAPKAAFLIDALTEAGETPDALGFADLGAGSGYFVSALRQAGRRNAVGYEVSEAQIGLADEMLGAGAITRHDLDGTTGIAASLNAEVVSMIGVLEHVQRPREILAALGSNTTVRYLFISVPLFSTSVYFEMVFPEVFQRQLGAGHTHLFTEQSLEWMAQEFNLERVAEWWFGTDMVDLYRFVAVGLQGDETKRDMVDNWHETIVPMIDELQLVLDKRKLSSEVHMLFRFCR